MGKVRRVVPMTWVSMLLGAFICSFVASFTVLGAEIGGKGGPPIDISGEAAWIATYAWGDPEGLGDTGDYGLNKIILKQLLSLRVSGQISPGLSLSADLDNHRTGDMQLVQVNLEGKDLRGNFGNLRLSSENPYLLYNTALRGFQLEYRRGALTATGLFGRAEGIAATKTFRGGVGSDVSVFRKDGPYRPTRSGARLEASWEGLEYYRTNGRFIEDFMTVRLRYQDEGAGRTLLETLTNYDLDYLYGSGPGEEGVISAGDAIPITRGDFVAISASDGDFLALLRESLDIIRTQVEKLISDYNKKHGLTGERAKRYPFVPGSDTERAFLEDMANRHALIEAGSEGAAPILSQRLPHFTRERFYYLGHDDVHLGSVKVEVFKGESAYLPEAISGFRYSIFYDRGILDFSFPASFFDDYDSIRVSYDYSVSGNVYTLGISVAAGSERVYLNGRLLRKDVDYTIDYPTGILILLVGVGLADELKVDYEYFRGGLGVGSEYNTNIMGGSLAWRPSENTSWLFEVYRSGDLADSTIPAEKRRTMPNSHTVAGASLRYSPVDRPIGAGSFRVEANLAYSRDEFPLDDNRRENLGNRINTIMATEEDAGDYVFFGHQGGLAVASQDGTGWRHFTPASGLAGYVVFDMASSPDAWYFATEGGLTRVAKSGANPFDLVDNWKRLRKGDGLPSNVVLSCMVDGFDIWIGTDSGLARSNTGDLADWKIYDKKRNPEMLSERILRVQPSASPDTLYCATDRGLLSFDVGSKKFSTEFDGVPVSSVAVPEGGFVEWTAFAGTDAGLRGRNSSGDWSEVPGTEAMKIRDLAISGGLLFIATDDGLYSYSEAGGVVPYADFAGRHVSALGVPTGGGAAFDGLWAGEEAHPGARLTVWHRDSLGTVHAYDTGVTGISDKDEYRFSDIDAADHTATGFAGSARVSYTYGRGEAFLRYERVEPGFTGIGRPERRDLMSWGLGGSYRFSDLVGADFEHGVDRTGTPGPGGRPSEDYPVTVVRDRVGASLYLGPRVDLSYVRDGIDDIADPGDDKRKQSYSVSVHESFFDDRLGLGVGYELVTLDDLKEPDGSYEAHNIIGDLSFRDTSGLYLGLRYRQPVKVTSLGTSQELRSGTEGLSWTANWSRDLGAAELRASYNDDSRLDIKTGEGARVRRGQVNLGFDEFAAGTLKLRPVLRASWGQDSPSASGLREEARGEAQVRMGLGDLRSTVGYSLASRFYPEQNTRSLEGEASLSASYQGIRNVLPSVELRMKNGTSTHPVYGTRASATRGGSFRVSWTPAGRYSTEASLSYKEETAFNTDLDTFGVGGRVFATLRSGLLVDAGLNFERTRGIKEDKPDDGLRTEFSGQVSYRWSEVWNTSLRADYIRGVDKEEPYETWRTTVELRARL